MVGLRRIVEILVVGAGAALLLAAPLAGPAPLKRHDVHTHLSPMLTRFVLSTLDESGIDRALNLSGGWPGASTVRRQGTYGSTAGARFEDCLEVTRRTHGRLLCACNVDWERVDEPGFGEAMAATLERAVAMGAASLKISKALGLGVVKADGSLLAVDDPSLDPLWDAAGRLGVPVTIHTGDPLAFFEAPDESNERYDELRLHPSWSFWEVGAPSREALLDARNRVIARHPDTIFIGAHMGNDPEELDMVAGWLDRYPNFRVDTAARLGEVGRHPVREVRHFFRRYRRRILFGSDLMVSRRGVILGAGPRTRPDSPAPIASWYSQHFRFFERDGRMPNPIPIQGHWDIEAIGLPAEVLEDLCWRNAERLIFEPWDSRRSR